MKSKKPLRETKKQIQSNKKPVVIYHQTPTSEEQSGRLDALFDYLFELVLQKSKKQ